MSDVVRCGVHAPLERAADALIYQALEGVTSQSAKSDILTPWKEADRHRREVMAHRGSVDPQLYKGMYHRKANTTQPHLNSRDGVVSSRRIPRHRQLESDWVQDLGVSD